MIIFCVLCDFLPSHCSHLHPQSRKTSIHDNISIAPDITNSIGSHSCGIMCRCADSGAIKPITDSAIGNPQQNIWGTIDAIIPSLTALFFILSILCACNYNVFLETVKYNF